MDTRQHRYGERLFPTLIDEVAAETPDKPFVLLPETSDPADGFTSVTYGTFARAVNRCTRWIVSELGTSQTSETLSFMSHARDFRYPIFLLAAVKAGFKAQFVSPKNSIEAHLSLLDATNCQTFVIPEQPLPIVSEILSHRPMRTVAIITLASLLGPREKDEEPFPFAKSFDEARFEPLVVLQTSGSTGTPKAITATHGTFAAMDAQHNLLDGGTKLTVGHLFSGSRWAMLFPFFHTGAYLFLFGYGLYYDILSVLPPPVAPSADLIDSLHQHGKCDATILPPSLIYPLFELPGGRERLSSMRFVAYAGGPLPRKHGDLMAPHVRLINLLGSTETAMYPIMLHKHDWEYVDISPFLGHEFRQYEDNLYELVIIRQKAANGFQGVFCTFPQLDEYHTRELYTRHATRDALWRNAGRVDDVIAFSNGEKFNPIDTELTVSGNPAVLSCMVTGRARFQASLIIEPKLMPCSQEEELQLLNLIWPSVVQANEQSIATGRIARDLILITKPGRPLPRTEKGTIKRALAEEMYQVELDELYEKSGGINGSLYPNAVTDRPSMETFESFLLQIIGERSRKLNVKPTEDFSYIGLDSIQYASILQDINSYLEAAGQQELTIDIGVLYLNSSVSKITEYLNQRLRAVD